MPSVILIEMAVRGELRKKDCVRDEAPFIRTSVRTNRSSHDAPSIERAFASEEAPARPRACTIALALTSARVCAVGSQCTLRWCSAQNGDVDATAEDHTWTFCEASSPRDAFTEGVTPLCPRVCAAREAAASGRGPAVGPSLEPTIGSLSRRIRGASRRPRSAPMWPSEAVLAEDLTARTGFEEA